jgi:hypothetical protein
MLAGSISINPKQDGANLDAPVTAFRAGRDFTVGGTFTNNLGPELPPEEGTLRLVFDRVG